MSNSSKQASVIKWWKMKKNFRLFFLLMIISTVILSQQQLPAQALEENWEMYSDNYENNLPGLTSFRMDLIEQAPLAEFPILLITGLVYRSKFSNGLPEIPTVKKLTDFRERLIEVLGKQYEFIYVGAFTYNYEQTEYFYLKSIKGVEDLMKAFYASEFPRQKYYLSVEVDSTWSCYREFLFPREEIHEQILDKQTIEQLQAAGDDLTQARRIDHWIYFQQEEDLERFKNKIVRKDFQIDSQKKVEDRAFPYQLKIWREDFVSVKNIYEITSLLQKLARRYDGEYDGWETFVVTD